MRAKNKLISFIGLGSNSASSLFYGYVRTHPEIFVPEQETYFFEDIKIYAKGTSWYESNFSNSVVDGKSGELALRYLERAQTAALIARIYPDAKLFVVIENPLVSVRVAYIEAQRAMKISSQISLDVFVKQNPEVLTRVLYGRQLARYFSFYSQNDLLILLAEDVRSDPIANITKVFEHIEVDTLFVPIELKHLASDDGENKHPPGVIKRTIRSIKKVVLAGYNHLRYIINPPITQIETSAILAEKSPMSPEIEIYLKDYFRKDVKLLSSLLHRDLNEEWGI
jgi:hypothetical protein